MFYGVESSRPLPSRRSLRRVAPVAGRTPVGCIGTHAATCSSDARHTGSDTCMRRIVVRECAPRYFSGPLRSSLCQSMGMRMMCVQVACLSRLCKAVLVLSRLGILYHCTALAPRVGARLMSARSASFISSTDAVYSCGTVKQLRASAAFPTEAAHAISCPSVNRSCTV